MYKQLRPFDDFLNSGIKFDKAINTADYYDFGNNAHCLNTFSEERMNEVIKQYPLQKTHKIPLIDINEIYNKMDYIDFVSLDVEGLELEILKNIDFNNDKRPKLYCIEANKNDIECGYKSTLVKYMNEQDYVLTGDNFINIFFADIRQIKPYPNTKLSYNGISFNK